MWPIVLLWICGWICFRNLSFGLRWIMFVLPITLIMIEQVTIDTRYNTIEMMWGYTWAVGLVALFPVVAARPGAGFWFVKIALLISAFISFSWFTRDVVGGSWDNATFRLEGNQYIRFDEQKRRMLQVVTQTQHATYLSGKCVFCYNEAPALAVFTGNRSYIAWSWFESLTNYINEAEYREKLNNDFYSGAIPTGSIFSRRIKSPACSSGPGTISQRFRRTACARSSRRLTTTPTAKASATRTRASFCSGPCRRGKQRLPAQALRR